MEFTAPALAFRSLPKLCHVTEQGNSRSVAGAISWKTCGQRMLSADGLVGPVEATWPANGEVQWRSRVVLLGHAESILVEPGATPNEGKFHFTDWNLVAAYTSTPDVAVKTQVFGASLYASFEYAGVGTPPEWCDVDLLWRGNPNPAKVRLPFPAWGARCFDSKGRQLADGSMVSTESLFGIRLVAFLGRTDQATLRLALWDGEVEADAIILKIPPPPGSNRVQIRLVDYLSRIRRMLATAMHSMHLSESSCGLAVHNLSSCV